jgi:hypothetical protein
MSRLAMAMPVGAQTVVTCSATNAARKPISAAVTYARATTAPIRSVRDPGFDCCSKALGYAVILGTGFCNFDRVTWFSYKCACVEQALRCLRVAAS